MSTLREAAELTSSLSEEDYRVLRSLAKLLGRRRHAPPSMISASSGLPEEIVERSLGRLQSMKLVVRGTAGYSLVYAGLDALALHELRRAGALEGVGTPIALGKESDVYGGIAGGREVAVKAYRIGRVSFRRVKRLRRYGPRVGEWLLASIRSASAEYGNLARLHSRGLPVPAPLSVRYHVLVMERLEGEILRRAQVEDPEDLAWRILEAVRRCYVEGGLVNADLNEYNIVVGPRGIFIVDWPQALSSEDPAARAYLERDVLNVLRYFRKRFGVSLDPREALERVMG